MNRSLPLGGCCAAVLSASLFVSGCVRKPLPDWRAEAALEELRAEVDAHPDDLNALLRYSAVVEGWAEAGAGPTWGLDLDAWGGDVGARIDSAVEAHPDDAPMLEAARGRLLWRLGQLDGAEEALRASLESQRSLLALEPLLGVTAALDRSEELPGICSETRSWLEDPSNVLVVLDACASHDPKLSWASTEDKRLWRKVQSDRQYQMSFAHEVRWADPERLGEAYGRTSSVVSETPKETGSSTEVVEDPVPVGDEAPAPVEEPPEL